MRVEIKAPSPLEAEVTVDANKNSFTAKPYFYGEGSGLGVAAVLHIYNGKGELLWGGLLQVSGKNGRLSVSERTLPVEAACERPAEAVK